MIVYKVTDAAKETRGGMKWEPGKKNVESGQGPFPGGGWLHAYASPEMAAIFHPAHVSFAMPRLFRAEAGGVQAGDGDGGVKLGFSEMALHSEIEMPEVSNWHRVRFALLLALETEKDSTFRWWANNVLGYGGPEDGLRPKFTAAQGSPIWRACCAYRDALDYTWHTGLENMILEHARSIRKYNPQHRFDLPAIARKAMETGNRIEEGPYTAANGVRFEVVDGRVYTIGGYAKLTDLAYTLTGNPIDANENMIFLRAAFGYTMNNAYWIGSESWRLFRPGQDITGDLLEAVAVRYQKSVDEAMAKICPMPTEPEESETPIQRFRATYQPKHQVLADGTHQF